MQANMQAALTTNIVTGISATSRGRFVSQTYAMTWEVLHFVLKEEGICPSRYERDLRNATQVVDDFHFQKAVETAKEISKSLLNDNGDAMRQLSPVLYTSNDHLYRWYRDMAQSTLGSEICWGRIVALMTFTGIVAARLVEVGEIDMLESVLGWERTFLSEQCYDWITSCGGWVNRCTQPNKPARGLWRACTQHGLTRHIVYIS